MVIKINQNKLIYLCAVNFIGGSSNVTPHLSSTPNLVFLTAFLCTVYLKMSHATVEMLDERLLQERLRNFKPAPLVEYECNEEQEDIETSMVVEDEETVDLAKANYLNVLDNEEIKKLSEDVIRHYGVGTCGPRAFYGTTDVHLELESHIADFLGLEEAIVYSYGFVAIASSVAAYCKKNDVVFIDKEANFAIRQGLVAARSSVVEFDHNDPKSFEKLAQEIASKEHRGGKFLVIEGVSWQTGKVCPLPEFLDIAEKYKIRVFLEESYSIGIFGDHGKGLTEHFNVGPNRIDMIIGTLENAIGSIGGFCAGTHSTIEHQRLSGSGYIFSASLPTFLVKAVVKSIDIIGDKPKKLRELSKKFHKFLTETGFKVSSDPEVPYKIFTSKNDKELQKFCKENGVHFLHKENGLIINLNVALFEDNKRIDLVFRVLEEGAKLYN